MCHLSSIKLVTMILTWLKAGIQLYTFSIGFYFATSIPLKQAYGNDFSAYGSGFIFLALISAAVVFPHKYAVDKHNRFLLLCCFFIDSLVFALLIQQGLSVLSHADPIFPKELQQDCLLFTPKIYTPDQCAPFYKSDRTAGFRLFWEGYFTGKADTANFQVLSTIQGDLCCGFFAPMQCLPNSDPFPSSYSTSDIDPRYLSQRVTCGAYPGYYPQDEWCTTYYDQARVPPIVGGCNFDLGVSYCTTKEILPWSSGCASAVEDYVAGKIVPHGVMIVGLSFLNFLSMLISCCMWWKRKEFDVFPEFKVEQGMNVNYREVKDPFELVPRPGLLEKEGYIDPENGPESKGDSNS